MRLSYLLFQLVLITGVFLLVELAFPGRALTPELIDSLTSLALEEKLNSTYPDWQKLCSAVLGRECKGVDDLVYASCSYYENLTQSLSVEARELCEAYSVTCTNLSDAKSKLCSLLGETSKECETLVNVTGHLHKLKTGCETLKEKSEELQEQKRVLLAYFSPEVTNNLLVLGFFLLLGPTLWGIKKRKIRFALDLGFSLLIVGLLYVGVALSFELLESVPLVREVKGEFPLTYNALVTALRSHALEKAKLAFLLASVPFVLWGGLKLTVGRRE